MPQHNQQDAAMDATTAGAGAPSSHAVSRWFHVVPEAADAWRWCVIVFIGVLIVVTSVVMILNRGELNKDYPKWYEAGQELLHHRPLYAVEKDGTFDFMYPPASAALLAPLTLLGPWGMTAALAVFNSICWWGCAALCIWLVRARRREAAASDAGAAIDTPASGQSSTTASRNPPKGSWGYVLLGVFPVAATAANVWDCYMLGQVSVVLLLCMLGAFACLHKRWGWLAGALVGLAAAIKAFPIAAIVYLAWRRQWSAVISTILVTALLLLALPACFVGWKQSATQLDKWADGMLFQYDAKSIGQRPTRGFSWKNQSILGVGHRLLRPVDANMKPGAGASRTMFVNVVNWPFAAVSAAILAFATLLGLFYIWSMPPAEMRTVLTDNLEWGMLLVLILMLSPFSFGYFNVWLMFPFAAGVGLWLTFPDGSWPRRLLFATILLALVLYITGLPAVKSFHVLQAVGSVFWAHLVMLITMGLAMRRQWKRTLC